MKEIILIIPNSIRNNIIKLAREKYYNYNIKFFSLEEFTGKYTFLYDNRTIYNLMKEFNIDLSSALVFLNNLCYISDLLDNDKMKLLKDIYAYLDSNNLLIYDYKFRNYVLDKDIYIYGYGYINKYYMKIFKDLNYKVINYKYRNNVIDNIYEFNYIDDEVIFVIDNICNLLRKGISINKIKLIIFEEYREVIYRLFKIYNIPISIKKRSIYSTSYVKSILNNFANTDNILDSIYNDDIKEKIVKVLNNYSFIDDKNEVYEMLVNDFKNTYLYDNINGVCVCDINDYFEDDDYVFLMGFNKENIPHLYKDDDYFSDYEKDILGYDTSLLLNINKKIDVIKRIYDINNLTISYKLYDNSGVYSTCDLLNDVNIIKDYKRMYINSNMSNKIFLVNYLDDLVKYNIKNDDLDLLYSNYSIKYMEYDNSYHKISTDKLYKYLNNSLYFSYTALNNYYECKFKYYISNILKINLIKDDFNIIIGNMAHYILSHMEDDNFDLDECYLKFLNSSRDLSSREKCLLNNVKEELRTAGEIIRRQYDYMSFDKVMTEHEVCVNKDSKIKVIFKGVIDKVIYKEEEDNTYLVVIDYKTGNSNYINLNNMKYGLSLQLPIYLYLSSKMNIKNIKIVGFYLQKLFNINMNNTKDYDEEREKSLRLEGYTINEENVISKFDSTYSDSKLIKSMKLTSKGFSSRSKVLSCEDINNIIDSTDNIINTATEEILEGDFLINPKIINGKNASCLRCEYKDICYVREKDYIYINEEVNDEV